MDRTKFLGHCSLCYKLYILQAEVLHRVNIIMCYIELLHQGCLEVYDLYLNALSRLHCCKLSWTDF